MYVLLENSITFEAKLIEHEVDYYVDYEGQPSLQNEGARYFLLEKDRVLIDQIVITNEIGSATETINSFEKKYEEKWINMMRDKLGLFGLEDKDKFLILDLLTWMHEKKADYTNTFCHLMNLTTKKNKLFDDDDFMNWKKRWEERLSKNNNSPNKSLELMKKNNPLVIPRNHKVEEALEAAEKNDLKPVNQLIEILKDPYTQKDDIFDYQIPSNLDEKYQTFCGT